MRALARWFVILAVSPWFGGWMGAQAPAGSLEPGHSLRRQIQRGEVHSYELRAVAGQYLNVVLNAFQTAMKATLTSPGGQPLVNVSAPGDQGPEEIAWTLADTGSYRIALQTADTGALSGSYTLVIRSLGEPAAEDRRRAAAFEAFIAAENLAAGTTAESRRQATAKYEESLSVWRNIGDPFWEGRVLHQIAFNWEALGQLIKARDALLEALPLRRASGNRVGEANSLNNLGLIYNGLGEPARALEYLSPALELRTRAGDRRGEAITLNNIAVAHGRMGEPGRAVEVLLRSLEIRQEVGDRLGEAITRNNLGSFYSGMGDYQTALERFMEALVYRREMGDRRGEAAALANVGSAYHFLGEIRKAREYMIQSVGLFEALGDQRGLSAALASLGSLTTGPDALTYQNRSLSIRRQIGDRQGEVLTLTNISATQYGMGEYRAALEAAEAGLEVASNIAFRRGEGESLFHAAKADRKLGNGGLARSRLTRAAELFEAEGARELESATLAVRAEAELLDGDLRQALASSSLAMRISESIRGSLTDPDLRASFRAYRASPYGLNVEVLMKLHRLNPADGFDGLALEASERSRARSLVEVLTDSRIDLRQALSSAQRQREDQILDRINKAQRELFRSGLPAARKPEVDRQLAAAEREMETFRFELGGMGKGYAAVQYAGALDRRQIQQEILDKDTALIEFTLGERQSWVWVLTRDRMMSAALPARSEIEAQVRAYRKELAQGASALTVRTALARLDAVGNGLYRDLLAPVEPAFGKARHLIIVPDGVLSYLPFETLGGGTRLVEHFAISYSPSASALATLRARFQQNAPPARTLLAFGDAVYSETATARRAEPEMIRERGGGLTQLPHTRAEVNGIRALFPAAGSNAYLGAAATEETVKGAPLDQYRLIHFAVHGIYDEEQPARSGIALSIAPESRQDGILQVPEIMRLRLRAEMVTLSACQSGLGKLLAGEGVMGMSRAFLYAGADSVLTSLWNVNDASTAELMKLVYQGIARGLARDEALRGAKLRLMRGPQTTWRHPYYWAAFVLLGDSVLAQDRNLTP